MQCNRIAWQGSIGKTDEIGLKERRVWIILAREPKGIRREARCKKMTRTFREYNVGTVKANDIAYGRDGVFQINRISLR